MHHGTRCGAMARRLIRASLTQPTTIAVSPFVRFWRTSFSKRTRIWWGARFLPVFGVLFSLAEKFIFHKINTLCTWWNVATEIRNFSCQQCEKKRRQRARGERVNQYLYILPKRHDAHAMRLYLCSVWVCALASFCCFHCVCVHFCACLLIVMNDKMKIQKKKRNAHSYSLTHEKRASRSERQQKKIQLIVGQSGWMRASKAHFFYLFAGLTLMPVHLSFVHLFGPFATAKSTKTLLLNAKPSAASHGKRMPHMTGCQRWKEKQSEK